MIQVNILTRKDEPERRRRTHATADLTPAQSRKYWEKIYRVLVKSEVLILPARERRVVERLGMCGFSVKGSVTCHFWPDEGKTWERLPATGGDHG